jgi:transcriptional regulator with GAF, ATPase, and Fis domain
MKYQLELLDGSANKWTVEEFLTVGADSTCQLQIIMADVDPRHCRVEIKKEGQKAVLFIKDLRSTHGTFVNGAKIFEAELQDGDLVSVGYADFVVHDLDKKIADFPMSSRTDYWNQNLKSLSQVALSDHSVLLLVPSGVGKDVIAKNIHACSPRANSPFMSVNCSALTETLVESELFGHVKGSFTGAISDRKGAFEAARGGTLFLDEIGDLPYSLQAKILRALENEEIRPVGSDKIIKTDVRIIAATHQNLTQKIREGAFRSDLYFRLNIITVDVPSLKERMEDFDDLIYFFARQMKVRFSFQAIKELKKYDWPGNIRELKNLVARASTLFAKCYITETHIDQLLNRRDRITNASTGVNYLPQSPLSQGQASVIKEIEKQMILKRLAANQGSQKLTATDLGIPKSTLHDRIKTYNIDVAQFR